MEHTLEQKSRLVEGFDHIHAVLRRLLLYEEEIGKGMEHSWVVGFPSLDFIEYLEHVALGELKTVRVLPREEYRKAVQQGCNRVLIAHKHPNDQMKFTRGTPPEPAAGSRAGKLWG